MRHGEPTQTEMTLGLTYMRAVELAGGLPVALPPLETENVDSLLEHVSGLLLSGGPDLDPACYGAEPHAALGSTDHAVDAYRDSAVQSRRSARDADPRHLPRGTGAERRPRQGTLHQHVPDLTHGVVKHRQIEPAELTTHEVRVSPDSSLAQTTGGGPVKVNSFHHQAIDRLGLGLTCGRVGQGRHDRGRRGGGRAFRPGCPVARRDARRRSRATGAVRAPDRGGQGARRRSKSPGEQQEDSGAHAV